jgi:dTDP-3-amino-2,3,6-trideoxy-4-keto-D-glucose/dTDP-3-amino-3,4,6-trideoxy-alpha-D-glucose/dTDP-2,6-dideoxy-D-kanosamine transaminase
MTGSRRVDIPAVPMNDLSRGTATSKELVAAALSRVQESGRYLHGPEVLGFERELASFVGTACCVGVGNGTDAIALALLAVGCEPGDEVVTAANAGMYTTVTARRAGLRPAYADVDPMTLCLSRDSVARALSPQTRAVVVTHLYGRLAEIESIVELCRAHGVAIVEDCAQAIGAARMGRRAGSFGDAAAFSFYPTKNLGALGDAGAVVTQSLEVAERVRSLAEYGWESKYRVVLPGGWNSRLDELQAAALRVQLPYVDERNRRRRELVSAYCAALPPHAGTFVATEGDDYVAHLAVILSPDRERAREELARCGIATDVHYPIPDHRQPTSGGAFSDLALPVTESAAERVLSVPCFPELTDSECARVCEALGNL